mmetsp:Transcript_7136/g.13928  ORF Transcript_7136/g.13928 Transcript_7136/m.13928 type:complete len:359 (+) Transcript_7136:3-1079(+)
MMDMVGRNATSPWHPPPPFFGSHHKNMLAHRNKPNDNKSAARLLRLPSFSSYTTMCTYNADTRDNEDHTFSGIMFDVEAKTQMPVTYIEIHAIWVRGRLGRIQVFTTPDGYLYKNNKASCWKRVHYGNHPRSPFELSPLPLDPPIQLKPGERVGIYVHSSEQGDRAIVYNNQRSAETHKDDFITIFPGLAHTSSIPFHPIGFWGSTSWRRHREFVGRMSFGAKFLLWNHSNHCHFPIEFQKAVEAALSLSDRKKSSSRSSSSSSSSSSSFQRVSKKKGQGAGGGKSEKIKKSKPVLPEAVIMYILNFCPWYWFEGAAAAEKKKMESRSRFGSIIGGLSRRLSETKEQMTSANGNCQIS